MATNTRVTTSTTVYTDLQNTTNYNGLLKDVYLPALTDMAYYSPEFTALITKSAQNIDYKGQRIVKGFKTQRAGGFGPIAEGGDFVASVPQKGQQGYEFLKFLNVYFQLSGPAIKAAAAAGEGSFIDVTSDSFEDTMTKAKLQVERIFTGCGMGILGRVDPNTDPGTGYTVSVVGPAHYDTMFFEPGMKVRFYSALASGSERTGTYTVSSITKGDKKAGTRGTVTFAEAIDSGVAVNDYICLANAYSTDATTTCLEPNGLCNLVADAQSAISPVAAFPAENASNSAYLTNWNLSRATYPWLRSQIKNVAAELDEENLTDVLIEAKYTYGANPDLFMCTPRAMQKYFLNVKEDRRFNTLTAMDWVGGVKGMGIQLADKQLMLTTVGSCPSNNAFMLQTGDFAIASMTNGFQWLTTNGQILTQKEGSDNQFATAVDYVNLVCHDPARQIKMYGITE